MAEQEALHGAWRSEKGNCRLYKDPAHGRLSYEEPLKDGQCLHGWLDAVEGDGEKLLWEGTLAVLEQGQGPWCGPPSGSAPEAVGSIRVRLLPGGGCGEKAMETQIKVLDEDDDWQSPTEFRFDSTDGLRAAAGYQVRSFLGMAGEVTVIGPFSHRELDKDTPPSVTVEKLKRKLCELRGPMRAEVLLEGNTEPLAGGELCELEDLGAQGAQGADGVRFRVLKREMPDAIYALMLVSGDEGCCHWSGQEVDVHRKSYATAKEAAADAEEVFFQREDEDLDCDSGDEEPRQRRWEHDNRKTPREGFLLSDGGRNCFLLKLNLAAIGADVSAAGKLTDHVYCLIRVNTDHGRPHMPEARWRRSAFVDLQSAARAAPEFWGVEDIAEMEAQGDSDYHNYTDDPEKELGKNGGVVLCDYSNSMRIEKLMLP